MHGETRGSRWIRETAWELYVSTWLLVDCLLCLSYELDLLARTLKPLNHIEGYAQQVQTG